MPHEPSDFKPPRKKPSALWFLAAFFLLLIFLFGYQLFGPNPPIIVSKQTTYITEPLGPDGLPDYEKYFLNQSRQGVTPENNAAVLIWQALWPGELDPPQYGMVARELGLDHIPSEDDALTYVHRNAPKVNAWLKARGIVVQDDELAKDIIRRAGQLAWTSDQLPPLADWIQDNQQPLDLLVEASRRPRCYFPSPSQLNNQKELLYFALLPGIQSAREAGRALPVRAMWHLGESRHDEAWQDLLATHRLARLVAQGPTLIDILVGIAIDGITSDATLALIGDERLTADQARQILRDLKALPRFNRMAQAIDQTERLSTLDAAVYISSRGIGAMDALFEIGGASVGHQTKALNMLAVDWNLVLAEINEWYDRLTAATSKPDWQSRQRAIGQFESDLHQMGNQVREPTAIAGGIFSRSQRSQLVAGAVVSLALPASQAAMNAEDRVNIKLDLLRLAAALAVYRAEHDGYPEKLDDLAPNIVDKLPVDLFHAKPFVYIRVGDAYLLYSTGENGIDDGGSNEQLDLFEGRSIDDMADADEAEKLREKIPSGADDHAIRLPRPAFVLPQADDDAPVQ